MAVSHSKNEDARRTDQAVTLAKSLAPEDVRAGDYVTVLHVVHELPSMIWCSDMSLIERDEIVRMQFMPENGGEPSLRLRCIPGCHIESQIGLPAVCLGKVSVRQAATARHQTLPFGEARPRLRRSGVA